MYPVIGASKFLLDWVHDNVTDLEVNLVTIGLPGGSGTSETKNKNIFLYYIVTSDISSWSIILHSSLQVAKEEMLHVHCSIYLLVIIENKIFLPLKEIYTFKCFAWN